MSVINSKIWHKVYTYLNSGLEYFKELLIINFFVVLIFISSIEKQSNLFIVLGLFIFLQFVLFFFLGKKRVKEIEGISRLIEDIRLDKIEQDEIKLKKNLFLLEKEIRMSYLKSKSDIDYLKRLEKMRTEFIGNVSHELRTPIFTIQGYIETLLNGAINDEKVNRSFLEKANHHTINLSNLLNDLIDLSMIESGELRMSFRYFGINEFMEEIIADLTPIAIEKEIELKYSPVRSSLKLFGDKSKIRQVMVNLIQNGLKYTEAGEVEVIINEDDTGAVIIVRDTGPGIPGEYLSRIFERFFRVDKGRARAVGGTGLGLAIAKHIIEAHSSKIHVKSEIDKGSEFYFRLKK